MRSLTASLIALAVLSGAPARAAPVDERAAAFEVLGQEAVVERVISNCRWLRRVRDDALRDRWRRDNREIVTAAKDLIGRQGGLTVPRRKVVEDLAGSMVPDTASTPEGCRSFLSEVSKGTHDLTVRVATPTLISVLKAVPVEDGGPLWVLEQRRLGTGVLAWSARRYEGEGDILDCEAEGALKGHVSFRRHRYDENMMPLPDKDADLWLAECMASPVNPVTGEAPPPPKDAT